MFIMYSKRTGEIKSVASGNGYTSIKELYPYDWEDYSIIYDSIVLEDKEEVLQAHDRFYVNTETKELQRKQELTVEDLLKAGVITAEDLKKL